MSRRAIIAFDCMFPAQTGGGERVYRTIAEELVSRGWEVEYLTRAISTELDAPFTLTPIWDGPIYDANGSRPLAPAFKFAFSLFRMLWKRRDVDLVIVSATPVLNVFAARAAFIFVGTKPRVFIDWLEIWPIAKWREYSGTLIGSFAWVAQILALRMTPSATANSLETISRMPSYLVKKEPILLGLTSMQKASEPRISKREGPPIVLFVGRLIPDKCVDVIPPALSALREKYQDARVVLIGVGPEIEKVKVAAKKCGVTNYVDFLGQVEDDELQDWYKKATVLLNPSRREGFGLVIVEAAAYGTPSVLVAGPENAASQLIETGVNGFLSESRTPSALAASIELAIKGDASLRKSTYGWFNRRSNLESFSGGVDKLCGTVKLPPSV